jgi:hypothetical protein
VGHNSRYAIIKKTTPTKDVFQSTRLINREISSLMGEKDDWESGLDDFVIVTNDLYNKAT